MIYGWLFVNLFFVLQVRHFAAAVEKTERKITCCKQRLINL